MLKEKKLHISANNFWLCLKKQLLFVYWLACWEILEICPAEVNESNPFPLAMGDGAHVVKKRG